MVGVIGLEYESFQDYTVRFVKEIVRQFNKFQRSKGIEDLKNFRLLGFWMIKSWGGKLNSPQDLISDKELEGEEEPTKTTGKIVDARTNAI